MAIKLLIVIFLKMTIKDLKIISIEDEEYANLRMYVCGENRNPD